MPSSDYTERLDVEAECSRAEYFGEDLTADNDFLIEQILENVNNTPLGQVLKRIAALPEVRQEKILDVRRRLADGRYDLNGRLDMALDRVLEELTG
jgi:hypothetical protein